jgi:hypothetical protein
MTCIPPFDVLPPGQRAVVHELVLVPSRALDGWTIVAAPTAGFGGHHVIVPGEPFGFSSKYGTRLFAATADESIPSELDDAWMLRHRATEIPVARVSSVPLTSPLQRITTRLFVDSVGPSRVSLHVVDEQRVNAFPPGFVWAGIGVLAALGLFGLMLVRRRRRRAEERSGA